jgi:molecular chaperone GrpE
MPSHRDDQRPDQSSAERPQHQGEPGDVVGAPGGSEPAHGEMEGLRAELAAKDREAAENLDRYLRERAELENVKKRLQREKVEAIRFANESLLRDLLPVLDNLERAIDHAESGGNGQPLVQGVRLVHKAALDVLERHGVRRVDAEGQSFDPSVHEALARVAAPEREPNQVVEQFLPGYRLHDRLLRPAQVSVSTGPQVEKPEDDD